MTSKSLWNYYRDDINDDADEIVANNRVNNNNNKKTISKSFEYKQIIPANNKTLNTEVVVPLKYLSFFGDLLIYL